MKLKVVPFTKVWFVRGYSIKCVGFEVFTSLFLGTVHVQNCYVSSTQIKERFQSTNLKWLKCSTSLVIREMQIKTTLRFHLTPEEMAKIKNTDDNLCWRGCGVKETLLHCWWECKLVQPLWMSVWQFFRNDFPQDPVILLCGIYQRMLNCATRTCTQLCLWQHCLS